MAQTKIFINGFGVIGRDIARLILTEFDGVELIGINDKYTSPEQAAYLLAHDSVYGNKFIVDGNSQVGVENNKLVIFDVPVAYFGESDLSALPLGELAIDVVIECTGITDIDTLNILLTTGAKKLVAFGVSSSFKTVAYGVNEQSLKGDDTLVFIPPIDGIVAAKSLKMLNELISIDSVVANVFQAYTNAQNTIDSSDVNPEMGRAGAWNIVPTHSAVKAVGKLAPELNGKVIGTNYRAPIMVGGAMSIGFTTSRATDLSTLINEIKYAINGDELFSYTIEPLVSSDVIGSYKYTYLEDRTLLNSINDICCGSICILYDNIRGLSYQACIIAQYISNL